MGDSETQSGLAWKMICELRQEVREAQKIRAQIIGVKIAFISASFAFIFGAKSPQLELLVIPAFTAVFFDFLIIGYGYSIKRIGYYCRNYLEPKLRQETNWPDEDPLWEEAMGSKIMRQHFSRAGNIGMTTIVCASAAMILIPETKVTNFNWIFLLLGIVLVTDIYISYFYKFVPEGNINGAYDKKEKKWKEKE